MIQSKDDLRAYLEADNAVQPMPSNPVRRYLKKVIRMKILLRKSEYHYNNKDKNIYHKIAYLVQWQRCREAWIIWLQWNGRFRYPSLPV